MRKYMLQSNTGLALCLGIISFACPAKAQTTDEWARRPILQSEYLERQHDWQVFLEYHLQREPCQHYRSPPEGYVLKNCDVYREYAAEAPQATMTKTETTTRSKPTMAVIPPDTLTFTIYFDHDKFNIKSDQRDMLAKAANAIKKYGPAEVIVSGYAARSGTEAHNQTLSERRAQTVAHELGIHGVNKESIEQAAYGETHLAVQTPDGAREPANRRVVIYFRR